MIKKIIKVSNIGYMLLDNIVLNSGDLISFEARILNSKPYYLINHESNFSTSSYYSGFEFKRACSMYEEILLAFKGVKKAEQMKNMVPLFENRVEKLMLDANRIKKTDMYDKLRTNPLFLGITYFK